MSSPAGNPAGVRSPHWSTGAKAVLLVGSTELELNRTKGYFFRQVVRDLVGLVIGEDDICRAVSIPIARCKAARPDSGDGQWIASVLLIDCVCRSSPATTRRRKQCTCFMPGCCRRNIPHLIPSLAPKTSDLTLFWRWNRSAWSGGGARRSPFSGGCCRGETG